MDRPDFDEIARRPLDYWRVDGLPDLVMGVLWMVWGTAWLVGDALPHDWRWNVYWMATPVLLAGTGVIAIRVIKALKARLTFPRTGYVEWKEPSRGTRLTHAVVAVVVAAGVVALLSMRGGSGGRFAAPILGVILALSFLVVSIRQRAPHYLALAGVAVALGIAIATVGDGWMSANWLFLGVGAATALAGWVRLATFLNRHPRVSPEGA